MIKARDYATRAAALARSAAILKASARNWRPAGVAADGFVYPEGEWPGTPVGNGRHCRPEIGIATHAVPVEEGVERLEGRFLVRDRTGAEVTEAEIKRPELDDEPVVKRVMTR